MCLCGFLLHHHLPPPALHTPTDTLAAAPRPSGPLLPKAACTHYLHTGTLYLLILLSPFHPDSFRTRPNPREAVFTAPAWHRLGRQSYMCLCYNLSIGNGRLPGTPFSLMTGFPAPTTVPGIGKNHFLKIERKIKLHKCIWGSFPASKPFKNCSDL